jgi:hypothetical protein
MELSLRFGDEWVLLLHKYFPLGEAVDQIGETPAVSLGVLEHIESKVQRSLNCGLRHQ